MIVSGANAAGSFTPRYLIESGELMGRIAEQNLVIVDVRIPEACESGHIRGAINIPVKSAQNAINGSKETQISFSDLEKLLGSKGIHPDSSVVLYDESGQDHSTFLFWILDAVGHKNKAILNGGVSKWAREGFPLSTEKTQLPPQEYRCALDRSKIATLEEIRKALVKNEVVLVDARPSKEFTGEISGRNIARGGHIPGAVNLCWLNHFKMQDGFKVYKTTEELLALYVEAGVSREKEVIVYCRSGSACTSNYFVLKLLAYPNVKRYAGSMIEWSHIAALPLQKEMGKLHRLGQRSQ